MSIQNADPLLRGTRILLVILKVIAVVVGVTMLVGIPAIWLVPSTQIQIDGKAAGPEVRAAITAIMAVIIVVAVLARQFLRELIAIIDSVKLGSPFVPENARRLRTMGWLVLAMEGLSFAVDPLSAWLTTLSAESDLEVSFSFGWLVTALLLFILARVFEQGTKLAEDVEGTV